MADGGGCFSWIGRVSCAEIASGCLVGGLGSDWAIVTIGPSRNCAGRLVAPPCVRGGVGVRKISSGLLDGPDRDMCR